jgi:cell division transport system permease protein
MFLTIKRILKWGFKNFLSQKESIFPTIFILFLTLFGIGFLLIFKDVAFHIIDNLKEKADVAIYFKEGTKEEEILKLKETLSQFPEIQKIEYVSKEEALQQFLERHKKEPIYLETLEVLGENPFLPSLHIKAINPFQYERLKEFFSSKEWQDLIDHQTYQESEKIINEIFTLIDWVEKVGIALILVFIFVTFVLITNTINLSILRSKTEIEIQKMVGASNFFVQGPFLIEGIICAILASVFAFLSLFAIFYYFGPKLTYFLAGLNVYDLFVKNSWKVFGLQILVGIILTTISSYRAVKRHLNV